MKWAPKQSLGEKWSMTSKRLRSTAVNHAILVHRMEHNFVKSLLLKLSCGVLQGSSLGPLLFILYINDLPQVSRFNPTLFADDTLLILSDKNLNNLQNKVKNELNKIDYWLKKTSYR